MNNRTMLIIKPHTLEEGLESVVVEMIEGAGLRITAREEIVPTKEQVEKLYDTHRGNFYFESMVDQMAEKVNLIFLIEGKGAVQRLKTLQGYVLPEGAEPNTIRAALWSLSKNPDYYKQSIKENRALRAFIHAPDPDRVEYEMAIFFPPQPEVF